jgi:hypothetical protein
MTDSTASPHTPLPITFARVAKAAGVFFSGLINQMSMISLFVLGLIAAFLGAGHYLFYRLHDSSIPISFFGPCVVVMIVYGWVYGAHTCYQSTHHTGFDGGSISARAMLQLIALLTAASFAISGFECLHFGWDADNAPNAGVLYLCAVPAVMVVFSIVYSCYANYSRDMLDSGARRFTSGRRTLVVLMVLTMAMSLYNIAISVCTLDVSTIWVSMATFAIASAVCIVVGLVFQANVSLDRDRGVVAR